jgi:riboflavin kinase/FMN adenylyltransferase
MGADLVAASDFNAALLSISAANFLESLISRFNIKYISCGPDYTFGRDAAGTVSLLAEFCRKHNISLEIIGEANSGGEKISSGRIRELIAAGEIEAANSLLSMPFCVFGVVSAGRGEGGKLTYPTANINPSNEKVVLGEGVYATNTYVGGKKYPSVTNAGAKPTFKDGSYGVETYLIDYNSPLYGQYIKVEFVKKMREVFSFPSICRLKQQIASDIEARRALLL